SFARQRCTREPGPAGAQQARQRRLAPVMKRSSKDDMRAQRCGQPRNRSAPRRVGPVIPGVVLGIRQQQATRPGHEPWVNSRVGSTFRLEKTRTKSSRTNRRESLETSPHPHGSPVHPPAPATALDIPGAGATFPYPIYAKWADAYKKETGVGLNYQSIGSGGGIKQIKAKTVTFGASDAPLSGILLDESGLVQFPMVMGGI